MPGRLRRPRSPAAPPPTSRDEGARLLARRQSNAARAAQVEQAAARQVVVEAGDSLWGLAAEHLGEGDRWAELAELNGLTNPSAIEPGQVLTLPAAPSTDAPSTDAPSTDAPSTASPSTAAQTPAGSDQHDAFVLGLARRLPDQTTPLDDHLPMARGAGGAGARLLQEQLVAHGAPIEADGQFGRRTEDMVRAFQVANGLAVTGRVDRLTAALLDSGRARGVDAARLDGVPGLHIGQSETFEAGRSTGLTDVVALDGVHMTAGLAPHWAAMRDAAAADGVELRLNSERSGFRTPEQQAALYRRYGSPRAVPSGWSNHQSGRAIDVVMTAQAKAWMVARAGEFGFVRPTYEEWHWEHTG